MILLFQYFDFGTICKLRLTSMREHFSPLGLRQVHHKACVIICSKMAAKFSRFHENRSYEVADLNSLKSLIIAELLNHLILWRSVCYEFPFLCHYRVQVPIYLILMMMNQLWKRRPWMHTSLR